MAPEKTPQILTPGYIYPLHEQDVLSFYLFPDEMEMRLVNGGGSNLHPSLGHSVSQPTGRGSPTFSFSVIFEGVTLDVPHHAGSDSHSRAPDQFGSLAYQQARVDSGDRTNIAQLAVDWIMKHIGPRGDRKAKIFVMRMWEPRSQLVRFTDVTVKPLIVSHRKGMEGTVRRFKATFNGEYFYPVAVDERYFLKRPKKSKRQAKAAAKAAAAVKAQTETAAKAANPAKAPIPGSVASSDLSKLDIGDPRLRAAVEAYKGGLAREADAQKAAAAQSLVKAAGFLGVELPPTPLNESQALDANKELREDVARYDNSPTVSLPEAAERVKAKASGEILVGSKNVITGPGFRIRTDFNRVEEVFK